LLLSNVKRQRKGVSIVIKQKKVAVGFCNMIICVFAYFTRNYKNT